MKREYELKAYCKKVLNNKYYIIPKKRIGNGMNVLEINESGNDILSLLEEGIQVPEVVKRVAELYDLSDEYIRDIERDVWEFIAVLAEFGIINIDNELNSKTKVEIQKKEDGIFQFARLQELYAEQLLPYKFFVELTYNCNLRCKHCYKTNDVFYAKQNPTYLNKEIAFRILDEIEQMGALEVYFTGGELFLNPDVYDIIKYASTKNFLSIILSNGNFIATPAAISKLKDLDLFDVRISVYGDKIAHDDFTRVEGSYDKSISALKLLNETMGIGTAVYVVTNKNFMSRKRLTDNLDRENINYVINTHLTPTSEGDIFPLEYRVEKEQFQQLYQEYNMPFNGTSCSAGLSRFRITPEGNVNPCELVRDVSFGNIYEKPIKEILNSKERTEFINSFRNLLTSHSCNQCYMQDNCNFCPAAFYLETKSYSKVPEYVCDITQVKYDLKEKMY